MDASAMTRLATAEAGRSRRLAVKTVLGGVTVATKGWLTATSSAAKKKRRKKCKKRPCQGKAPGESCTSNQECCANETGLACAAPNSASTVGVCCGAQGASCTGSADCCNGLSCLSGRCQVDI
jgi:hypothetical protein